MSVLHAGPRLVDQQVRVGMAVGCPFGQCLTVGGSSACLDSTLHHPVSAIYCPFAPSRVPLLLALQQHAIHGQAPFSPDAADPAWFAAQLGGARPCHVSHVEGLAPFQLGVQR